MRLHSPSVPLPTDRAASKSLVMGVQTLLRSSGQGARPAGLRDVTNSPLAGAARTRSPLKRAAAADSQHEPSEDEPSAKQVRGSRRERWSCGLRPVLDVW